MRRSKNAFKLRITGLCEGNPPVTTILPSHKGLVTRKMFPFDDVTMVFIDHNSILVPINCISYVMECHPFDILGIYHRHLMKPLQHMYWLYDSVFLSICYRSLSELQCLER